MANQYSFHKIHDSSKKAVIKLTGIFDGTGQEVNSMRITANTLNGALDANGNFLITGNTEKPYYGLSLYRCWYSVNVNGGVSLNWSGMSGRSNTTMLVLSGSGEYNENGGWGAIPNDNPTANANGNIGLVTTQAIGNNSYTIILELHKDNRHYNAGQLTEPSVFNYGTFGVSS
jgi:hypothetical protein